MVGGGREDLHSNVPPRHFCRRLLSFSCRAFSKEFEGCLSSGCGLAGGVGVLPAETSSLSASILVLMMTPCFSGFAKPIRSLGMIE